MLLAPKPLPLGPRLRPRPTTCTECRRRHQKCDLGENGPCRNCLRRFPRPKCIAEVVTKLEAISRTSVSVEEVVDNDIPTKQTANIPLGRKKNVANWSTDLTLTKSYRRLRNSSLNSTGGILTDLNLSILNPINTNPQNTECFYFFFQWVGPHLSSIDGKDAPQLYTNEILPALLPHPVMPNVLLLIASTYKAMNRGIDPQTCPQVLSLKAEVYSRINDLLGQDFKVVGIDLIRVVLHLALLESFLGSNATAWSHMKGLKQMLRLVGGISGLKRFPLIVQLVACADYELACFAERPLYLQDNDVDLAIPDECPAYLSTPLLPSPTTFHGSRKELGLSDTAADILDNVRFLTLSITCHAPAIITSKIRNTSSWLHRQMEEQPTVNTSSTNEPSMITATIRHTALVYMHSISTLTPFSKSYTRSLILELQSKLSKVPLSRWKQMPGIFFWILMVASSSPCWNGSNVVGRMWRRKVSVTGLVITFVDFNLAIMHARAFYKVQRWIAEEGEKTPDVLGHYYDAAECGVM